MKGKLISGLVIFFIFYLAIHLKDFHTISFELVDTISFVPLLPNVHVLLSVITVPNAYERRSIVRNAYLLQHSNINEGNSVDVRFVFCNLSTEEERVLVAMEIMVFNDIIILNCTENMNEGKMYTYFSSLPSMFGKGKYDYVVKTDDDTYFRLDNLIQTLIKAPKEEVYLGLLVPHVETVEFMSGMGYILSWDMVEWISRSEMVRNHTAGPEDVVTAKWLEAGGRGKNKIDVKPRMYDFPEEPFEWFRHDFIPDTLAVHKLKDATRWAKTLRYFNVTNGLVKPSKYPL
ncbi:beta-1,3-galactosyltransferase pvg3-like [Zingiber officinale]|nr:beta-1,3-galactosyltransferase pvg3-like [Zingiber officinale]